MYHIYKGDAVWLISNSSRSKWSPYCYYWIKLATLCALVLMLLMISWLELIELFWTMSLVYKKVMWYNYLYSHIKTHDIHTTYQVSNFQCMCPYTFTPQLWPIHVIFQCLPMPTVIKTFISMIKLTDFLISYFLLIPIFSICCTVQLPNVKCQDLLLSLTTLNS